MKTATREWVDKAEADYAAALLLRRSRKKHARDIVCFHLQQCAEKYLKARLEVAALAFPKIHDLERLLDVAIVVEPLWPALAAISDYAVAIRYPGRNATVAEANTILRDVTQVRSLIRHSLGLR